MSKFKKWIDNFDKEEILKLSNQGLNIKNIAKQVNIPPRTLGDMITYFNLDIKKGFNHLINDDYFNEINTVKKAYILGYLIGDGAVLVEPKRRKGEIYSYNKRISFTCSIDDLPILKMIRDEICPSVTIRQYLNTKGAENRKISCRLRWSSKKMVDDLINNHSVKPRKTYDYTFKYDFTKIPEYFQIDFINGLFDADGTCTAKTSHLAFEINSPYFGEQIGSILKNQKLITDYKLDKHSSDTCTWYTLRLLGGFKTKEKLSNVFYQKGIGLERKKVKLQTQSRGNQKK